MPCPRVYIDRAPRRHGAKQSSLRRLRKLACVRFCARVKAENAPLRILHQNAYSRVMAQQSIGIIVNGATGRIGSTQHLANALVPIIAEGGLEAALAAYLSPEHRDSPESGCTLAALLPELARQPLDTRSVYMERFLQAADEIACALPPEVGDSTDVAIAVYATLIGTLQLARAVNGTPLSDRILQAGAQAARGVARRGLGDHKPDGATH